MEGRRLPLTMFEKIWGTHVVATMPDETALMYVDCHLLHEGSRHAFEMLHRTGRTVRRPELTFAFADHLVPTQNQSAGIAGKWPARRTENEWRFVSNRPSQPVLPSKPSFFRTLLGALPIRNDPLLPTCRSELSL
jgi:hypothetical protein